MKIMKAGRQNASSPDASSGQLGHTIVNTTDEYGTYRNSLIAFFSVMPALQRRGCKYGVEFDQAQKMADCVIAEKRQRFDLLPPHIRDKMIQELVKRITDESVKVRLVRGRPVLLHA